MNTLKNTLRKTCLGARKALSIATQQAASQQVCERIYALAAYQQATHIALYHAIDGEICLASLWARAVAEGKFCYMPLLHDDKTLSFLPATPSTPTQTNRWGIQEPKVSSALALRPNACDLMLIPLVAFDPHGTRLGRGAGYYDRTLAHARPTCLLGVAYAFQQQAFIQPEPWDIPLSGVVTEQNVSWYAIQPADLHD